MEDSLESWRSLAAEDRINILRHETRVPLQNIEVVAFMLKSIDPATPGLPEEFEFLVKTLDSASQQMKKMFDLLT